MRSSSSGVAVSENAYPVALVVQEPRADQLDEEPIAERVCLVEYRRDFGFVVHRWGERNATCPDVRLVPDSGEYLRGLLDTYDAQTVAR